MDALNMKCFLKLEKQNPKKIDKRKLEYEGEVGILDFNWRGWVGL